MDAEVGVDAAKDDRTPQGQVECFEDCKNAGQVVEAVTSIEYLSYLEETCCDVPHVFDSTINTFVKSDIFAGGRSRMYVGRLSLGLEVLFEKLEIEASALYVSSNHPMPYCRAGVTWL